MQNTYIAHSRTKGSKNGERLYQNKDGSLTPLGREHYGVGPPREKKPSIRNQVGTKLSKWASKRKAKREAEKKEEAGPDISKMSNEELTEHLARMKLEKEFKKTYDELHPKKVSALKEMKEYGKKIIKESVQEAFKQKAADAIKSALDLNSTETIKAREAYLFWKKNNFAGEYAPGSVKNPYSDEYLKELNRTTTFSNKTENRTTEPGKVAPTPAAATSNPRPQQSNNTSKSYSDAKAAVGRAQSAYDKARKNGSEDEIKAAKRALDQANVEYQKVKQQNS